MKYISCKIHDFMVKYLVGLATQFRNKKCVTYLAGLLITIFEKSPPGQLNCRVAKYFWGQSPNGSVIWPGQLIGTQEYFAKLVQGGVRNCVCTYKGGHPNADTLQTEGGRG